MKSKLWILLLLLAFILICESKKSKSYHKWHGHKSWDHGKHSGRKSGSHHHKGSHKDPNHSDVAKGVHSYDKNRDSQQKGFYHYKHQILSSILKHATAEKDSQNNEKSHGHSKFHGHGNKVWHGHAGHHGSKTRHGHTGHHSIKKSHGHSKSHGWKKGHSHSKSHGWKKSHGHSKSHGWKKSHSHSKSHGWKKSHGHSKSHGWKKSHWHSKSHGSKKSHGHSKSYSSQSSSQPTDIEEATSGEVEETTENYEKIVTTTESTPVDKVTEQAGFTTEEAFEDTTAPALFSEYTVDKPTTPLENVITESIVKVTTNHDVDKYSTKEAETITSSTVSSEKSTVFEPTTTAPVDNGITNPNNVAETTEYVHDEVSTNKVESTTPSDLLTKQPEEIETTTAAVTEKFPCTENGVLYTVGTFVDPEDKCGTCTCDDSGSFICKKRKCPKLKCGRNHHVKPSADSCCSECAPECTKNVRKKCPKVQCKRAHKFYSDDSCCPQCGCKKKGSFIPEGEVLTEDPCDKCVCANGKVTCQPPDCPIGGLQCVDVQRDANCTYYCPNGKTCFAKGVAIPYGEFKKVGKKVCTCIEGYFPNAFCVPTKVTRKVRRMQKNMCVSEAEIPDTLQMLSSLGEH